MFLDLDRSQFSVNNTYSLQLTLLEIITDNQGVRAGHLRSTYLLLLLSRLRSDNKRKKSRACA